MNFWKGVQHLLCAVTQDVNKVFSFVISAGVDTSRLTVTYLIGHLVNHPKCQQRVHDELDAVVGKWNSDYIR